jgi:tetratricopeptide (TPR) repeat protein
MGFRKSFVAALAFSIVACGPKPAPVAPSAPRYPDYPVPVIPPALVVAEPVRARHSEAWRLLQSGDLRGASRAFTDNLRAMPDLYPSETGLGYALLAQKDFDLAAKRFASATSKNANYLPAWVGAAEANLARGADADAIVALEHILALDPQRPATKSRLELLRFKQLPAMIEAGQRARRAERWDEARTTLETALAMSPTSPVILRELALVELGSGALPAAETRARRAVAVDDRDAESHATLAMVLEARGNGRAAADEYDRAVAIDPRPEWRDKATGLRSSAELAVIPPEFRTVPTAATVTRAQVAAYVGIRLERLITRAPARVTEVATDVRNHWASPWILPVTRAGIMEIQPNHMFDPAAQVRRGDLARIVSQLLAIIPQRQMDLVRWRQAKPRFADVPPTHVFYAAAALAVSAGAMNPDAGSRFDPTRPASGPDLVAAIARVEEIAGR